eukprot:CAMPEP_0206147056 /NCGR_PEP_ID=MMETSP1473-20131121/32277_1 /ASSEMBLY_ACC=CAM_ASM_001109 /TAXON_ID=1461547 /ORGANISM="Stichococcus sp, Strain RCC1054" /LENGTH=200 /DNA_ID=CAMNT_0053543849 /DNA_START=355 /DNA_END=954 /DNA_ORIENTATION=+
MRRRPGIAGLQRGAQAREHYKSLGEHVQAVKLEHMRSQLAQFKASLEQFAISHREEIRRSPEFRAQFHTMCANIGVDPLASNKGAWAQLLGFGDFYSELGVQVIEACLATRSHNGGMLDLDTLHRMVERRRGSAADPVSRDDLRQAIKKLSVLGGGFQMVKVGGRRMVQSVPKELDRDGATLMDAAQVQGYGSEAHLQAQ